MTIAPTTSPTINRLTNAAETISTVTSTSPYVFQLYNTVTKAIVGIVQYRKGGPTATIGGILACDTYANLQAEATANAFTGTLTADPTPH
jgi:hypothetical protein